MITFEAFFIMIGGVVGRALLDRPRLLRAAPAAAVSPPKPPRITEMNERFMPLHMM